MVIEHQTKPTMYSTKFIFKLLFILSIVFYTPSSVFAVEYSLPPENVSVSAIVTGPAIGPIDGGGGGMLYGLIFSGWAYPKATVHIWKDGIPKTTTIANDAGYFSVTLSEIYKSNVLYTLYAIDKENRKSILLNYPIAVKVGYFTQISGIRFPPTISTDKSEVKVGDSIIVKGYALPNELLDIVIEGITGKTFYVTSNSDGTYETSLSLFGFRKNNYNLHVNYNLDKKISKVIQFTVGDANILSIDLINNIPGDCNADQIINIVDFSVAAFWYGKQNPPRCIDTNNDKIINLVDFSVLAFYWTG